jgi:hypothetical protein
MDRDVEGFMTGHGLRSVSERYGPRWPKTLLKAVNMYPRFRIPALKEGQLLIRVSAEPAGYLYGYGTANVLCLMGERTPKDGIRPASQ